MNIKISNIKKLFRFYCYKIFAWVSICLLFFNSVGCNTTESTDSNGIDTTSHNFSFQTWTFGEHSSSVLYDVAIINENDIWAVGEIYLNDSTGNPEPQAFNSAHWDGVEWELFRTYFPTVCSSTNLTPYPAKSIFAFDDGQIWISSSGDKLAILQNSNQTNQFCLPPNVSMSINKIWGSSSSDLYVVGNNGVIAHYNGSSWVKIESGTELNIYDIYGQKKTNGKYEILCVAANQSASTEKKIMMIDNNSAITLSSSGIMYSIRSIWFKPNEKYYVVGSGMYSRTEINSSQAWVSMGEGITQYYVNSIDANGLNDIVVCGAYGELLHFNGIGWQSYQSEVQLQAGSYREIKIKDNFFIAVGYDSPKALITIGRR